VERISCRILLDGGRRDQARSFVDIVAGSVGWSGVGYRIGDDAVGFDPFPRGTLLRDTLRIGAGPAFGQRLWISGSV
jgi:hypothetical protein